MAKQATGMNRDQEQDTVIIIIEPYCSLFIYGDLRAY